MFRRPRQREWSIWERLGSQMLPPDSANDLLAAMPCTPQNRYAREISIRKQRLKLRAYEQVPITEQASTIAHLTLDRFFRLLRFRISLKTIRRLIPNRGGVPLLVVLLCLPFGCCFASEWIFKSLSRLMDFAATWNSSAAGTPSGKIIFLVAMFLFFNVVLLVQRWHSRGAPARLVIETRLLLCRSLRLAFFSRSPRTARLMGGALPNLTELALRREYWAKQLSQMPRSVRANIAHSTMPWVTPAYVFFAGLFVLAMYSKITLFSGSPIFMPWIFFAVSWLPMFLGHRRLKRLREALDRPICPDCGYNLEGLPESKDRWGRPAPGMGPHCCPECGTPWPMIPPAIPKSPDS